MVCKVLLARECSEPPSSINTQTLPAGKGQPMANEFCWEGVLYTVVKKARKAIAQTNSNLTGAI